MSDHDPGGWKAYTEHRPPDQMKLQAKNDQRTLSLLAIALLVTGAFALGAGLCRILGW